MRTTDITGGKKKKKKLTRFQHKSLGSGQFNNMDYL